MRSENNIIIGIDTSCYTTSIAAISLDEKVLFNERIVLDVKENSKGLRQREAVFQHINNISKISEKIEKLIENYNIKGICASKRPRPVEGSYMPVFNVGYNVGKLMSTISKCPFYETSHQENHIEASLFEHKLKDKNKFLSVHMSGGTMEVLLVSKDINASYNIDIVGGSRDISFGQLIDRVGVSMGYKFPAGRYIDENALNCTEKILQGLKTSVKDGYMNLSGLENQVNRIIGKNTKEYISKLVLDSVVRNMFKVLVYLSKEYSINEVVFAGGVAASKYISKELTYKLEKNNIKAYFCRPEYSTDNAVGCAIIGLNKNKIQE